MNMQRKGKRAIVVRALASVLGLCAATIMCTVAHAENREVKIINETDAALVEFHASNAGTSDWEEDLLGQDTVRPNGYFVADIDDGSGYCRFDFKAVFNDGQTVVKYGVDVCRIEAFRFTSS